MSPPATATPRWPPLDAIAIVTASDYVSALLERAAARAAAEGTDVTTRVADCEDLPFADDSFDAVLSVFGMMFAPRQELAAAELVRVTSPGGRIGLASWTPTSFVAGIFETVSRFVPPPPVPSVFRWGNESDVRALLGPSVDVHSVEPRDFVFRYCSAEHFVDTFRAYYGPTHRAFVALDTDGQHALEQELVALARGWNRSTSDVLAVPGEYPRSRRHGPLTEYQGAGEIGRPVSGPADRPAWRASPVRAGSNSR